MRGRFLATLIALFAVLALAVGWYGLAPRGAQARSIHAIGGFQRVAEPAASHHELVSVFFMSALYCPFCAAERWALVEALGRFGTWSNLTPATSTEGIDGFSALPTYDFAHARYTSALVAFTARDVADAQGHPLENLSPAEQTAVNRYDPRGSIPFLLVDGAFAQLGSGYSPGLLVNNSFDSVRADLQRKTPLGEAIHREADVLTTLICIGDGGRPQNVCNAPAIRTLEEQAR